MMRFLPVSLNALLVELDDLEQTLALLASLKQNPIDGVVEMVPAARTIMITWRPGACSLTRLAEKIERRDFFASAKKSGSLIEIPVHYTGEDLADVASLLGIAAEEVIRRHTGAEYTVAFTGFAPGFAYLSGGHSSFDLPRRGIPRTRIPAGSVGLAGTFSGVYPQASPGGWQIIGVTPMAMWDSTREAPALLQPGNRVKFVDARSLSTIEAETFASAELNRNAAGLMAQATPQTSEVAALEIQSPGLLTLFQDLGRAGRAMQGVSAAGAMDQGALKAANRLVGNPSNSACLETVCGGLRLCSRGGAVIAVTGADAPLTVTSADGRQWRPLSYEPFALDDGDYLSIGQPHAGMRSYLAVRGGFVVEPVLGSCSTDTLAHVGPAPLASGDVLAIRAIQHAAVVGFPEKPPFDMPSTAEVVTLDVVLGPRTDWFTAASLERLSSQLWQVTPQSNRIGLRLEGEVGLERAVSKELPSEGTAWGAIQVPPGGQPVLFLADHPLTGGYPVIGCVASYHLDRAGQVPINAWIRFNPIRNFDAEAAASVTRSA